MELLFGLPGLGKQYAEGCFLLVPGSGFSTAQ